MLPTVQSVLFLLCILCILYYHLVLHILCISFIGLAVGKKLDDDDDN